MNNEPVAWMNVDEDGDCREFFAKSMFKTMPNYCVNDMIPLYTHPAKTLTDEEILEIWKEFDDKDADNWFIAIARAILRKAQEK